MLSIVWFANVAPRGALKGRGLSRQSRNVGDLERDVRQILNVSSLRDFERFLRACAARSAQLLDKAALARDVGVSSKAANDWLSVLEASNQVQLLEPYFENLGKRLIKSPKLYLSDTGLLCFLLGLDERSLPQSPYLGTVWESAVYAQLRKQRDRSGDRSTLGSIGMRSSGRSTS